MLSLRGERQAAQSAVIKPLDIPQILEDNLRELRKQEKHYISANLEELKIKWTIDNGLWTMDYGR